ncbi:fasciclin domain-containing protein [Actomonas aquatica]|uniref:Fasciclin domain-containing protein n=1 Tax=Actomonas aquatica TaxID=2866162 RepID=A0ABZ1C7I9_9BACT|nr:fasciclin domain-containing protein [Opitutus sp. WL0086]WRQ87233.1 fasciclin domain-containing protein [Opitutus sp. WL0086]
MKLNKLILGLGLGCLLAASTAFAAHYTPIRFVAELSGDNEVPAVSTDATGTAELWLYPETNTYTLSVTTTGLSGAITGSHIHEAAAGSNGAVAIGLGDFSSYTAAAGGFYAGTFSGDYDGDLEALLAGEAYVNIHTAINPGGELRGQLNRQIDGRITALNYSARGLINPGNGRVGTIIGGFVLGTETKVLIRAMGESLQDFGINNALPDAAIELYNSGEVLIASNDDWKLTQSANVQSTGFAPLVDSDAAIVATLPAGSYTTQVDSSKGAGVAVLEVYVLGMDDLVAVLSATGQHDTLVAAIEAAGLDGVLMGPGPFTVFAPTDAAFAALPAGTLDNLLLPANVADLQSLLLYHVLSGSVMAGDLSDNLSVSTLQGSDVTITLPASGPMVNAAAITEVDIQTSNGVIHSIDSVLMP